MYKTPDQERKELYPEKCPLRTSPFFRRLLGKKCIEGCSGPVVADVLYWMEWGPDFSRLMPHPATFCGSKEVSDQMHSDEHPTYQLEELMNAPS